MAAVNIIIIAIIIVIIAITIVIITIAIIIIVVVIMIIVVIIAIIAVIFGIIVATITTSSGIMMFMDVASIDSKLLGQGKVQGVETLNKDLKPPKWVN